jgi:hypothetical protein
MCGVNLTQYDILILSGDKNMDIAKIEAEAKEFKSLYDAGEMDWAELDGSAFNLAEHWLECQYAKPNAPNWTKEEELINFYAMKRAFKVLGMR